MKAGRLSGLILAGSLVLVVGLVGCGTSPTPAPTPPPEAAPSTPPPETPAPVAAPECDAEHLGPIVRCRNFVSDFWPIIEQHMEELHQRALAEEGGQLVDWGFSEETPVMQRMFSERFPGMSMTSRGLQFGTAAAIVEAVRAGAPTTDRFGGAYTIFWPVWEEGLFDEAMDWTALGIPEEFLDPALPGMLPHQSNQYIMVYNTNILDEADLPTDPFDFLEPEWRGTLVSNPSYTFGGFSYIAMKFGEEEAIDLLNRLMTEQDMVITSDPESLLLTGERSVMWPAFGEAATVIKRGPHLAVAPYFEGMGVWRGYYGILKDAQHPNAAKLFTLWRHFDPSVIEEEFTNPDLRVPLPYMGLHGYAERNPTQQAALNGLEQDAGILLTLDNNLERDRLVSVFQGIVLGN